MRYKQRLDGEPFEAQRAGKGAYKHRIACCDCGLVHDFAFILEGKRLYVAAKRNNRATSARRRNQMKGIKKGSTIRIEVGDMEHIDGVITGFDNVRGVMFVGIEIPITAAISSTED